jgi:hypothetical protein
MQVTTPQNFAFFAPRPPQPPASQPLLADLSWAAEERNGQFDITYSEITAGNWVGVFPRGNTRRNCWLSRNVPLAAKKRPKLGLGMSRCITSRRPERVAPLIRPRHAISEPREPQYWQQPSDEWKRATDDNGCRWEWKFSLDADRRPELSCRCRTCGVKYYLSSWQWTLDSGCDAKCLPPTGKHLRETSGIHKVGNCSNRGSR